MASLAHIVDRNQVEAPTGPAGMLLCGFFTSVVEPVMARANRDFFLRLVLPVESERRAPSHANIDSILPSRNSRTDM